MKALITVGDKTWEVPEQLTVEQFSSVQMFGYDNPRAIKLLCATVLKAPLNAFNGVDDEDLNTLLSMCLVPLIALQEATADQLVGMDFAKLTFGQFCDLDVISHRGLKANLPELISVLFNEPVDEILERPINLYWPKVEEWLTYRSNLYSRYSSFFGLDENDAQTSGGEENATDAARVWYQAMIALAAEDFLKIHQVAERPVIEALNFLAYLKDKRFRERQEIKRQQAQHKRR
jgi:hypothetical protein